METLTLINIGILAMATLTGIVIGVLPGVGIVVTMLLFFPLLLSFDLFQCLMFYLGVTSASQFSGSVIATTLGVPGEASSWPAVKEGNAMFKRGKGDYAISSAAMGSVFGASISALSVVLLLPVALEIIKTFYNNNVQIFLFALVASIIIFLNRKVFQNILLFGLGLLLGTIGMSQVPLKLMWKDYIPYDVFPDLYQGLPLFPVILALFVVPTLINNWNIRFESKGVDIGFGEIKLVKHFKKYLESFWSGIRGSVIGSVAGLVPHVTTYLASNVSYLIEKRLRVKKKIYHEQGDIQCLTSAETANNSAAFVQLMPLLLIGIPITTSEAILLTILETNSFIINYTTTIETGMFSELVVWFVLINIISFCLAWPLVRYVNMIYKIPVKIMVAITFSVMLLLLGYVGSENYQTVYYFICFLFLLPIGVLLRNTETIVVIIAFVLQDKIFAAITRALTIWSM